MKVAVEKLGISYELTGVASVSIGRKGYGADIEIDHDRMSRTHAELKIEDGNLKVLDKFSKNGVLLNGQPITPGVWQAFNANDELSIVGFCFSFTATHSIPIPEKVPNVNRLDTQPVHDYSVSHTKQSDTSSTKNGGKLINEIFKTLIKEQAPIKIGRAETNDIVLPDAEAADKMVSREHAEITFSDGQYWVKDLGSRNGTYINGERLRSRQLTVVGRQDAIVIHLHLFSIAEGYSDLRKEVAIRAVGLEKKYGNAVGLHALDIEVARNQIVALMGPSGCGKSTLLKALNGDNPSTAGEVFIHGLSLRKNYNLLKRKIGYVPQDDTIHKELTVKRTLYLAAKLRLPDDTPDKEIYSRIAQVLAGLNLEEQLHDQKVEKLSGGQRKRVCIAVELLSQPTILFLDEPTSPLDPESIKEFLDSLKKLAEGGTTIIMVTHKPEDLDYADKIIFLAAKGFIVHQGQKDSLLHKFSVDNIIKVYNICGGKNFDSEKYYLAPSKKTSYQQGKIELGVDKKNNLLRQLFWLTRRYLEIKISDRKNLMLLFAQPFIIAGLIAVIFHTVQVSVMMLVAISAIWFGVSNSSKEIVSEYNIYKRERMFNLNIHTYIFSKWLVLSSIALLQVFIFLTIIYLRFGLASDSVLGSYLNSAFFMFYIACAATLFGLFLSAFFSTTEKVLTVVPIALMPQIMLAGIVERITNIKIDTISYITLGRWGTEGLTRLQKGPFKKGFELDDFYYNRSLNPSENSIVTLFNSFEGNLLVILIISVITYSLTAMSLKQKDTIR